MIAVTVYSTGASCSQCRNTCLCLDVAGIPYTVVDLNDEANAVAREHVVNDLGYSQAPVVLVDEHRHWQGFRGDLIYLLAHPSGVDR